MGPLFGNQGNKFLYEPRWIGGPEWDKEIVETEETPRSTDKTNVLYHESFVRELHSVPHIFRKRQKSAHMLRR
jgi:hypothetical protein